MFPAPVRSSKRRLMGFGVCRQPRTPPRPVSEQFDAFFHCYFWRLMLPLELDDDLLALPMTVQYHVLMICTTARKKRLLNVSSTIKALLVRDVGRSPDSISGRSEPYFTGVLFLDTHFFLAWYKVLTPLHANLPLPYPWLFAYAPR